MINIIRIKCGNGNCFLVHKDKVGILIDTSKPQYKDLIIQECSGIEIKLIVLTHGHMDHALNAAVLSNELHAPLAMHSSDIELIEDNLKQPLRANTILGKILLKLSIKNFKVNNISKFNPKILLTEGMNLKEFGIDATIIELSGHTKGSIGVIVKENDIIVGDALMNMIYPTKSMIYTDREKMEDSAKRIGLYENYMVHFGHGKSVINRKW